jgi:hypothetical protein
LGIYVTNMINSINDLNIKEGSALDLIAKERSRQVEDEGWTPEHDDTHVGGNLALAAACYAIPASSRDAPYYPIRLWPFWPEWFKPTPNDRLRELAKAGALIVAEIERLQRSQSSLLTIPN